MIKLNKLEEPDILKTNAKRWTQEYLQYINNGQTVPDVVKKRYSSPEIKTQLLRETNGKCAYCESKFTHICPGDIEHILPKNKEAHPELYVTWSNLTMACESCNRSGKKTYNNDNEPLLNPYTDEIDKEIYCAGPMIFSKASSRIGVISIDVLNLNRAELLERRIDAIKKINLLRIKYEEERNEDYKNIIFEEIKEEVGSEKEYSFVLTQFCLNSGIDVGNMPV